jgi:homogentisate 1,2-dioxygenase
MNKTKRVAIHKHRVSAKKAEIKRKAQKSSGTPTTAARR